MHDTGGVRGGQRVGDLRAVLERVGEAEFAARQNGLESAPLDEFHGDVIGAAIARDIVDGDYVRVVEGRGGFGFLHEALLARRVGEGVVGKQFEGDGAVEVRVARLVHHAHAAFAQFARDGVVRQLLADQGASRNDDCSAGGAYSLRVSRSSRSANTRPKSMAVASVTGVASGARRRSSGTVAP